MNLFTMILCLVLMIQCGSILSGKNLANKRRDVFGNVKPTLTQKTQIPLRLPTFLPDDGDPNYPIYTILGSADPYEYEIQLAWTQDCDGGNYCHYGTVQGSVSPIEQNDGKKTPVTLERKIKGTFVSSTCGAHCDDSSIEWKEGNYYYSVSIKAENLKNLIRVANSAILSGH